MTNQENECLRNRVRQPLSTAIRKRKYPSKSFLEFGKEVWDYRVAIVTRSIDIEDLNQFLSFSEEI